MPGNLSISELASQEDSAAPLPNQSFCEEIVIDDCSGACLPSPGGSSADTMNCWSIFRLKKRALAVLDQYRWVSENSIQTSLERIREAVLHLSPHGFIAAFRSALSYRYLLARQAPEDSIRSAVGMVRFLIGSPDIESLNLVIPSEAFHPEGLYLPHLHAVVQPAGGPVAVQSDECSVRFTWSDGLSVTVPSDGRIVQFDSGTPRLCFKQWVGEWPLLNGLPDVMGPPLDITPQPDLAPTQDQCEVFGSGIDFLRQVWPEALATARRFFTAALFQPSAEAYTTSLSIDSLQGAFIASVRDPVQIGDALCHECSHTRLSLFFMVDPLINDNGQAIHPSPWRSDLRPLKGLLNGVHAFVNVCLYYQRAMKWLPTGHGAENIYEIQRGKVMEAWAYLVPRLNPTRLGAFFVTELEGAVKSL